MAIASAGVIYGIAVIVNRLLLSGKTEGWEYLMAVLLVVSGVQLLMLGVLGEYLWRGFDESRNRPVFIVDRTVGFGNDK